MSTEALRQHAKHDTLIARCRGLAPVPTAVVHPCDEPSLSGAIDAAEAGIIVPFLVGPVAKIRAVAEKLKFNLGRDEIVDVPHSHAAAAKAVELVRLGKAELLMKGSLHTDELLAEVVRNDTGCAPNGTSAMSSSPAGPSTSMAATTCAELRPAKPGIIKEIQSLLGDRTRSVLVIAITLSSAGTEFGLLPGGQGVH
jgi:hypothetical protein